MQIKKRLERLEREYFPESEGQGIQWVELDFYVAFGNKYDGRKDSAPAFLRRAYDRLEERLRWYTLPGHHRYRCRRGDHPR